MQKQKWYSPQIRRDLVRELYFKAKAEGIAMTVLANRLIESALAAQTTLEDEGESEMRQDTNAETTLP